MTIEESRAKELKSQYDVVVQAPASFFLIGEYAVLYGKPAIVLPVPIYLKLGMKLTNRMTFDLIEAYRPSHLDCRYSPARVSTASRTDEQTKERILRTIKRHMEVNFHSVPNGIMAETISDIPTMSGLGSSGAFCAATSLAVHVLVKPEMVNLIERWQQQPLKSVISTPEFESVFQLAWDLEKILHGASSGCGPFASLAGSPDSLPLVYSVLDDRNHKIFARRMSELFENDVELLLNTLWDESGFAIVFSGQERGRSEQAIIGAREIASKIEHGLHRMKRQIARAELNGDAPVEFTQLIDLETAKRKSSADLWDTFGLIFIGSITNLLSGDVMDLKRMVNLAQSLLSFLMVSTSEIDKFALACNSQYGTACKITGSGKGGDVLLFGEKPSVKACVESLVQEPRALHFASWLYERNRRAAKPATTLSYFSRMPESPPLSQRLPRKADFAIIVALEPEFRAVKSRFGIREDDCTREGSNYYYYGEVETISGVYPKRHFIVCAKCIDRGNRAAQSLTKSILDRWNPGHVLLVGTAGGVEGRDGVELGDVIASRNVIYDQQKQINGQIQFDDSPCELPSCVLLRIAEHMQTKEWQTGLPVRPDGRDPKSSKVILGELISGDRLRGDPNYVGLKIMLNRYPRAVAVEMEAGGVSYAIWNSHPKRSDYLVIKGVTDLVNVNPERNQQTREEWRDYACKTAASFAYLLVQNI
jgi:mevalonate kinase/nucleoside phosphorylase